uniref:uncharacterized protein n=1 Tax=Myxine glutinosa TaxID=7769 RepID=UPI00358DE647
MEQIPASLEMQRIDGAWSLPHRATNMHHADHGTRSICMEHSSNVCPEMSTFCCEKTQQHWNGNQSQTLFYGDRKRDSQAKIKEMESVIERLQNAMVCLEERNVTLYKQLNDMRRGENNPESKSKTSNYYNDSYRLPTEQLSMPRDGNQGSETYQSSEADTSSDRIRHSDKKLDTNTLQGRCKEMYEIFKEKLTNKEQKYATAEFRKKLLELEKLQLAHGQLQGDNETSQCNATSTLLHLHCLEQESTWYFRRFQRADKENEALRMKLADSEKQKRSCAKELKKVVVMFEQTRCKVKVLESELKQEKATKEQAEARLQILEQEKRVILASLDEVKQDLVLRAKEGHALMGAREEALNVIQALQEESGRLTEEACRLVQEKQGLQERAWHQAEELEACRTTLACAQDKLAILKEQQTQLIEEKATLMRQTTSERELAMAGDRARRERAAWARARRSLQAELQAAARLVERLKSEARRLRKEADGWEQERVNLRAGVRRIREETVRETEGRRRAEAESEVLRAELARLQGSCAQLSDQMGTRSPWLPVTDSERDTAVLQWILQDKSHEVDDISEWEKQLQWPL